MDLRGFIDVLSREGCLRRIDRQVDWKCELGELTRSHRVPLLFENIKDYPGHRVFTNGLINFSSLALALGLTSDLNRRDILSEARKRVAGPIRPLMLESGPVLENIIPASEIDFLKFPVPQWRVKDGGRYIGTWHINVTRDPETGARNLGVYRMQVVGPGRATVSTFPKSHLSLHLAKAERAGRPLEMAVAIGASEPVVMAASAGYPCGQDEYELAGALQGEPIRLVKCSTVDLEVPADSEITVEGIIRPGVRVKDGPYFDYAGVATTNQKAFLFEATRLMYRNNPVFRGSAIGQPAAEDQILLSVLSGLNLFDFHGSRAKRFVQAQLLKGRFFRMFQLAGRIGPSMFRRGSKERSGSE